LLKEVKDPQRFGVPVLEGTRVTKIEEKPANPQSPYAVLHLANQLVSQTGANRM
jgi:glucose-1-phosphate thymidylyltransferase